MKENLNDLRAFSLVAQLGSFTKAAAELGVSQSALSHSIKLLEDRLGVKLLHRTTRNVSATELGERLQTRIAPFLSGLDDELEALSQARGQLKGRLRISGWEYACAELLWDKFRRFMQAHPDVELDISTENRNSDIVSDHFDAGIRLGDFIAKDMKAARVTPDIQLAVVGSPDYFARYGMPKTPQGLTALQLLASREPKTGGVWEWPFQSPITGDRLVIQPQGQFRTSSPKLLKQAALDGLGLCYLSRHYFEQELANGSLVSVLDDWAIRYTGYYLYYSNKKENSPILKALIEFLRD